MMLTTMLSNYIQMMLPAIETEKRGEVLAGIVSASVGNGTVGMSDDQRTDFLKRLVRLESQTSNSILTNAEN